MSNNYKYCITWCYWHCTYYTIVQKKKKKQKVKHNTFEEAMWYFMKHIILSELPSPFIYLDTEHNIVNDTCLVCPIKGLLVVGTDNSWVAKELLWHFSSFSPIVSRALWPLNRSSNSCRASYFICKSFIRFFFVRVNNVSQIWKTKKKKKYC